VCDSSSSSSSIRKKVSGEGHVRAFDPERQGL
jgi:hypothetical protein